ncbi:MAG TPA: DUF2726 domain-containing protein, partial [Roseiflexaceae bacterium]|nr:DUF2726 domain-containing protein [Roseiflexaceae bacterium]
VLFAQVRLANLIRPTSRNPKQNKYDFYRIQAKCVDFVLCDAATTAPRLVVELDDASHDRAERKARDSFVDAVLAHVNLPVLHVRWQRSYSQEQLAGDIRQALGLRPVLSVDRAVEKALAWKGDTVPPIAVAPPAPVTVPAMMAETMQVKPAVVDPPALEQRWACGQCHQPVRKEAQFCQHCGATLGSK